MTVIAPSSISVPGSGEREFSVKLLIKGTKLPAWTLNGGPSGGNGALLNGPEYDGYITLTSGSEKLSLPWHVLPRKASAAVASPFVKTKFGGTLKMLNIGSNAGDFDVFSLTGQSDRIPRTDLPGPGDNFAVVDLQSVGVRHLPAAVYGADYLEFAMSTFGRRVHPVYPAEFDIYIDSNNDGTDDYVVFNAENGGFSASGQDVVFVANLTTGGPATAVFFADADLNSGNMIFTVPMNASAGGINVGVAARDDVRVLGVRIRQLLHRCADGRGGGHAVHAGECALLGDGRSVRDHQSAQPHLGAGHDCDGARCEHDRERPVADVSQEHAAGVGGHQGEITLRARMQDQRRAAGCGPPFLSPPPVSDPALRGEVVRFSGRSFVCCLDGRMRRRRKLTASATACHNYLTRRDLAGHARNGTGRSWARDGIRRVSLRGRKERYEAKCIR